MSGYVKLFSTITRSSVWVGQPPHVKLVWITLLAMSDARGFVRSSVPGVAKEAEVSLDEARDALARFMAPDPHSSTPDNEGRRIETADGGWRLLNYPKYRDLLSAEGSKTNKAERQKRWRQARQARSLASSETSTASTWASTAPDSEQDDSPHSTSDVDVSVDACRRFVDVSVDASGVGSGSGSGESAERGEDSDQDAPVPCPGDLSLTGDQAAQLDMNLGIPEWAIQVITAKSRITWMGWTRDRDRPLSAWRSCLVSKICETWSDRGRRPKKPEPEPEAAEADTAGKRLVAVYDETTGTTTEVWL